ncbi:concanavalin A-like lectin/glucanase domain-containing protein [Daedaleopsis nitida]|nr:concanavalin A-like lectin/glucanase domain-containing protein [Daedaleopsis nitida]
MLGRHIFSYHPHEWLVLVSVLLGLHGSGGSAQKTLQGSDCTAAGAYTLCQNLWGADSGVGSQTTTLNSADGNTVAWETKYTWANSPNNVKSYPNVYHNTAKGMQLQDVVSAPTTWQWDYRSATEDLRADVSYDIWFGVAQSGDVASAASSYEIMVWLSSRGGIGGIGGVVAQNLQIAGHSWNLHHGPNSNWDVFSFITAEGDITDFDADLNDFFQYLVSKQGVAKTQYIQAIQAGTEPFTGSADLVITNFSVDVSTTTTTPPPASSTTTNPPSSSSKTHSQTTSSRPSTGTSSTADDTAGAESPTDTPPAQTSTGDSESAATSVPAGGANVRTAGDTQCRLRAPGDGSATLRRRREERSLSWIGRLFR